MICVCPLPVVGVKENLNPPSRALYRVRMSLTPLINQSDRMVDSAVYVSVGFQNPVRRPAINADRSAGFDPGANNSHQGVSGSVRNVNEEGLSGLPFDTARHPLYFHGVSPFVLAPTDLDVDFDSLVSTADLIRTAKHILQGGISAKLAPVKTVPELMQCSSWTVQAYMRRTMSYEGQNLTSTPKLYAQGIPLGLGHHL